MVTGLSTLIILGLLSHGLCDDEHTIFVVQVTQGAGYKAAVEDQPSLTGVVYDPEVRGELTDKGIEDMV